MLAEAIAATDTDPCESSKVRREMKSKRPIDIVNRDSIYYMLATVITPIFVKAHREGIDSLELRPPEL